MENAQDRIAVVFLCGSNHTGGVATGIYQEMHANGLDPAWDFDERGERGYPMTVLTIPVDRLHILQNLKKYNPARWGNPIPEGRPERIPSNGLYWFRTCGNDMRQLARVTDDRVKLHANPKGVLHNALGHAVIFEPVDLGDFLNATIEAFVISMDGQPIAAIRRNPGDHAPLPTSVLDAYAKQYAIHRKGLTWDVVRFIPMPE